MSDIDDSDYVGLLNSLSDKFTFYFLVVTLPIGLIGNLISLFIYSRPNLNRKTNTGFLYAWLCVANLAAIAWFTFVYRSNLLFNYSVDLPCGLRNYLRRIILSIIPWMQALISFDRFIAVVFPKHQRFMSQKKSLFGIMLVLFLFVCAIYTTNVVTYPITIEITNSTLNNSNTTTPLLMTCFFDNGVNIATNLIVILMRVYVPFLLMICFNLSVIIRLRNSKKRVAFATTAQKTAQLHKSKETKFAMITILIDTAFFVFNTPIAVFFVIQTVNLFKDSIDSDRISTAYTNFFNNVAQLISFGYSELMIFIFVAINRFFREEILIVLKIRQPQASSSRNHT